MRGERAGDRRGKCAVCKSVARGQHNRFRRRTLPFIICRSFHVVLFVNANSAINSQIVVIVTLQSLTFDIQLHGRHWHYLPSVVLVIQHSCRSLTLFSHWQGPEEGVSSSATQCSGLLRSASLCLWRKRVQNFLDGASSVFSRFKILYSFCHLLSLRWKYNKFHQQYSSSLGWLARADCTFVNLTVTCGFTDTFMYRISLQNIYTSWS